MSHFSEYDSGDHKFLVHAARTTGELAPICISSAEWKLLKNGVLESLRVMSDQTYWLLSEEAENDSDRLKSTIHESRVEIPSTPAVFVAGPLFRGAQDRQLCQYFDEMLEKKDGTNWSSSISMVEARRIVDTHKNAIDSSPYWEAVAAFVRDYDEVSNPITASSGSLDIGRIRKARSLFVSSIQRDLDSAIGMGGEDFLTLIRDLVPLLNASGLIVRPIERAEGNYQFELGSEGVCLNDLSTNSHFQRIPLERFPKVKVMPIEELNNQATLNDVASKNIRLLSIDQFSKLNATEFFKYFDRVHEHVDRKELANQMQLWLDARTEQDRDFGASISRKRNFAIELNSRAKRIGFRFKCPICDVASGLAVVKQGNSKSGQFFFSHETANGRVKHSMSTNLPGLCLVGQAITQLPDNRVIELNAPEFFEYIDRMQDHVDRKELANQMQLWLDARMEQDSDFGASISRKRNFAIEINSRAKRIGFRFKCPTCKVASGLSVVKQGNSKSGQFFFSHESTSGRVTHSLSTNLPRLTLVPEASA